MIARQKGKIANIASTAGLSLFGSGDYRVSKYGVIGLSHHLAWELVDYHINVNVIYVVLSLPHWLRNVPRRSRIII